MYVGKKRKKRRGARFGNLPLLLCCIVVVDLLLTFLVPARFLNLVETNTPQQQIGLVAVLFHDFNADKTGINNETMRRINHALAFMEKSGSSYLVVAGGYRPGEEYSGARFMADYALQTGRVAGEKIIIEDRSMDSFSNLVNIAGIMDDLGVPFGGLVSSPLHLLRIRKTVLGEGSRVYLLPYDAGSCSPPLTRWEKWKTIHYNLAAYAAALLLPSKWYDGLVKWVRENTDF